jgi:hypothetical protein
VDHFEECGPSAAKPRLILGTYGAAEAAPFQNKCKAYFSSLRRRGISSAVTFVLCCLGDFDVLGQASDISGCMAWKGSRYWLIFFLGGICSGFIFPVWTPSLLSKCVNQIQQGHLVAAEQIACASQELTSGAEARTHFRD